MGGEGGVQFKAVSEMPRPYVTVVLQATEHCRFAKSSLTRRGDAPNKLLNLLEQLLHKIKANRRREMIVITAQEVLVCHCKGDIHCACGNS